MTKQSQLARLALNDFIQAGRGEPPQCSKKHWSDYREWQAALPLQCRPSRPDSGDGDLRT